MNDWSRASLGALLRIGCALCSLTAVAGEIRLPRAPFFHLDAEAERAKVAAGVSVSPKEGIPLKEWSDRSPQRLRFQVDQPAHSPRLHFGEGWSTVRFDGVDDALRMLSPLKSLSSANLWIAIAPHGNPGDFRGFLAANAPGQRDYVSGMNIDLGPGSSFRWESINVEGQGFSGAQNTPLPRVKFGNLKIVEVQLDGREGQVIVSVDGKELGRRPWSRSEIAIDEWTLGARYYTNGPGEQQVRGHLACDIAEVIVFDGVLTREQREGITAQLIEKHRRLAEILPSELKLEQDSDLLVKVPNPPAVQMLEGGFEVHRLPLELTNINNVLYRHDGALITLGYNGDIHVLRDLDGDGLEDTAQIFFKNQGSLRGPIGMVLTRPDDPRGFGVFVASKGKVSLFLDKNLDDVSDEEIVVARGWKEIEQSVDAVGLAMAPDGSLYFGLGTTNYANAYLLDNSGKSEYDLQSERGTIQRISSDLKTRETICTGVRFPIGIALHPNGDLFCTDQEGATWLPNGNPFDELLHIERGGKHYGFPPRHPKHNPNVLDEPSVFDFGPQHQSTCGLHFNPESNLPNRFGPEAWGGNAFVSGESRGKLWRVQLVKTDVGYVAQSQLIACLQQLTIDSCVSPRGELVVACHSGPPDWGTGPAGMGSLYKIRTVAKGSAEQIPRPVLSWRSGANELSIAFDAPIDPIRWTELSKQIRVEGGEYVRAGDRFENLIPPYAVVQSQLLTRRKQLQITSIGLSPDLRTLTVGFRQTAEPYYVAATIPSVESLNDDRHGIGSEKTRIAQQPEIDVDCGPFGVAAEWIGFDGKGGGGSGSSSTSWSGWLPHLD